MIYVLEDDPGVRDMMTYTLKSTGFESIGFPDAQPFWDALKTEIPELILLDIMLPRGDGIDILKKLRKLPATCSIPVILATAKGTEYDKVSGLDLGADDYLAKPFGMMEMVSRVRAVLRRTTPNDKPKELCVGLLCLNEAEHTLIVKNERVQLTLKEFEVLRLLMNHPGRVFTRDNLLHNVWETDYDGGTRTVDVHIRTLRSKLGVCAYYIKTVRGLGYKLEVIIE